MKIGILTFHCAINYGALFQTYGLQQKLKEMGHQVSVIDYSPDYLKRPYRLFFPERIMGHGFRDNLRMFVRECMAFPFRLKRNRLFQKFTEKNICISDFTQESFVDHYDILVIGSDQVWNTAITEGLDPVYWGKNEKVQGVRHISYAASAGSINSLQQLTAKEIKQCLGGFTALSVREYSLADFLEKYVGIKPQVVLDPVLLAGRQHYQKLCTAKKTTAPYLLLFTLNGNKEAQNISKRIAKEKNIEWKELISNNEVIKDLSVIRSASPEDFLTYFQQAEYVVSTSFHGTVFAILFRKPFFVYCDNENIGERISNLLKMLHLSERMLNANSQLESFKDIPIKWNDVNKILETKRQESMTFLYEALCVN